MVKKHRKLLKIIINGILIIVSLSVLALAFGFFYFINNLPSMGDVKSHQLSESTKIYDRTGDVLLYEISDGQKRTVISLEEIPKYLKDATIAVEDEHFYEEPAFNWTSIIRAFLVNTISGRILEGGSTITQQLAKNAFLSNEQTITRKIKELILAVRLNQYYSKDEILGLYLNQIPYGSTAYGVEAASKSFFGKRVSDLNLAESAIIAALPKAPTYYSPWGSHQRELLNRADFIIEKMFKLGKINQRERDEALKYKPDFAIQDQGIKAPHFVMTVQDYLVQKYGEDFLRKGGLSVKTTLDWNLQQLAEQVVTEGAKRNQELYRGNNAALVAQDPKTGQILALVGSRDYFDTQNEGNFNVAVQGLRQPGSALKPFVYLTAFEKGYSPETVVFDVPTEFAANNPDCPATPDFLNEGSNECFHPQNFDEKFRGPISFKDALAQSVNIPAVKVLYLANLYDAVKTASTFGLVTLDSPDLYGLSLVLGGGAVKLIDLVGAYATLAQEGIKHRQSVILEIKDKNGQILESFKDQSQVVVNPQYPRLINSILSDAEARTPLFSNSLNLTVFPNYDVALKTGTSNDYRDAWSIGYTPSLAVGVWAGNNDNSPMQKHGSSILAAVPIWHDFMTQALANYLPETFNRPDPVTPNKPVLAGNYNTDRQIHTILYSINRNDPEGSPPQNPADDPQFNNWEEGVINWAKQNVPGFQIYNQTVNSSISSFSYYAIPGSPAIFIEKPKAGDNISGPIDVSARIEGMSSIIAVKIYLNNFLIHQSVSDFGKIYELRWSFVPLNPPLQNLLEIEATDQNGLVGKNGVIIYK